MIFLTTLSSVSIMGVMVLIGTLLRRNYAFTPDVQRMLITLIVNIGLPSIILASIFNFELDSDLLTLVFLTFGLSVALNITGIVIARSIARLRGVPKAAANEIAITATLGNTAFIGIPLCAILLGAKGALLAAVFDAGLDFVMWTVAVFLLQSGQTFSLKSLRAMINIPMMAIVTGMTLGLLQFEAPDFLKQLTKTLAAIASPLGMIYIGLLVPDLWHKLRTLKVGRLSFGIIFKIIIFPLGVLGILLMLPIDSLVAKVIIIQATMPTLTLASVLFQRYDADVNFGTAMTIVSVLLSLITIPIMVYLASDLMAW